MARDTGVWGRESLLRCFEALMRRMDALKRVIDTVVGQVEVNSVAMTKHLALDQEFRDLEKVRIDDIESRISELGLEVNDLRGLIHVAEMRSAQGTPSEDGDDAQ